MKQQFGNINQNTIFLDICSGIGTIGMCLAENCKETIGIEMVESACKNAEKNRDLNNIKNYKIICSKVEDCIEQAIQEYQDDPNINIVGVLDPPRAGLHKNVVQALRNCKGLKNLIYINLKFSKKFMSIFLENLTYVACSPPSIIENLNYLTLPTVCKKKQTRRRGDPFTPIACYGVDIFPQTEHFEGIFYLRRE